MSIHDVYDHFHRNFGQFYPTKGVARRTHNGREQIANENRRHWLWDDAAIASIRCMDDIGGATVLISNDKIIFKPTPNREINPYVEVKGHALITASPLDYLIDHPEMDSEVPFLLVSFHSQKPIAYTTNWYLTQSTSSTIWCFPPSFDPGEYELYDIPAIREVLTTVREKINGHEQKKEIRSEIINVLKIMAGVSSKKKSKKSDADLLHIHSDMVQMVQAFRPHELRLLCGRVENVSE